MSPLLMLLRGLMIAAALAAGLMPAVAHAPMPASPCLGVVAAGAPHHAEADSGSPSAASAHHGHHQPSGDRPGHHEGCCSGICLCALSAVMPPALPVLPAASPAAPAIRPAAGIRGLDRRPELPPPRQGA